MNILIVSATNYEIQELINYLKQNSPQEQQDEYLLGKHKLKLMITGVGTMQTAFSIGQLDTKLSAYDLAINLGICGSFDLGIPLGTVVDVISDRLGDLGVEEADGNFHDVYEMELENGNIYPYQNGWITKSAQAHLTNNLIPVRGVTVQKVTGTNESIQAISRKYQADVESMEGAAFFYSCAKLNIPTIQIRAISNYVEPRNKANWKMVDAINNLNQYIIRFLEQLEG